MNKLVAGLALVAVLGMAGCGASTTTVTIRQPVAAVKKVAAIPKPARRVRKQRPVCATTGGPGPCLSCVGPECAMTATQKIAYNAEQERKVQETRWAIQWKEEQCSLSSCPETPEEAQHNVEAAILRDGWVTFALRMREAREGVEYRAARRRQSQAEAERSNEELEKYDAANRKQSEREQAEVEAEYAGG
jgi:hypothetical protein